VAAHAGTARQGMTWRRAIFLLALGLAIGVIVAFRLHR
jgi:hypothetical protein